MRSKRDIQRDIAENDARLFVLSTLEKYEELNIVDILLILSSRLNSESHMLKRHYNVEAKIENAT